MTTDAWLKQSQAVLTTAGIQTSRLDCLVLLEDCLTIDRSQILANLDLDIPSNKLSKLEKLLSLRTKHMPLAYLRGKSEFYGRDFVVSPAVLIPRPESEAIIDLLKDLAQELGTDKIIRIADVGCGSGALGITAAKEIRNSKVELLDIDDSALNIAKLNVDLLTADISVVKSDLLSMASPDNTVLLCNLPYVPDNYPINTAARHEPNIALYGGADGLDLYRRLFNQIKNMQPKPLFILSEAFPAQHSEILNLAIECGYKLRKTVDFIQLFAY